VTTFVRVWAQLGWFAWPLFATAWIAFAMAARTAFLLAALSEHDGAHARSAPRRGLRLLATCAAAAPLIGLLGTVWGLVSVFGSIDADAAAADAMSHGLRVALLTTEVGLACAIPALGAHAWLSRALTRRLAAIEAAR